jgi:tripartite-type tricarboxylate transporter receptor subunit TctC
MFGKRVAQVRDVPGVLLLGTALLVPLTVHAQPYPSRLIKIVVPYAAGGAVDVVAEPSHSHFRSA